jgi:hypothetical protein
MNGRKLEDSTVARSFFYPVPSRDKSSKKVLNTFVSVHDLTLQKSDSQSLSG